MDPTCGGAYSVRGRMLEQWPNAAAVVNYAPPPAVAQPPPMAAKPPGRMLGSKDCCAAPSPQGHRCTVPANQVHSDHESWQYWGCWSSDPTCNGNYSNSRMVEKWPVIQVSTHAPVPVPQAPVPPPSMPPVPSSPATQSGRLTSAPMNQTVPKPSPAKPSGIDYSEWADDWDLLPDA